MQSSVQSAPTTPACCQVQHALLTLITLQLHSPEVHVLLRRCPYQSGDPIITQGSVAVSHGDYHCTHTDAAWPTAVSEPCFHPHTSSQVSPSSQSYRQHVSISHVQNVRECVIKQSQLQPSWESGASSMGPVQPQSAAAVAPQHALAQGRPPRCLRMPSSLPPAQPQHYQLSHRTMKEPPPRRRGFASSRQAVGRRV